MEDINITTIEWTGPEYSHKERGIDFFWTIGIVALVSTGIALWYHNYLFAIFILISGACLILFTVRPPQEIHFKIATDGIRLGRTMHPWKTVKGFHIYKGSPYAKLLIETSTYFLPVYTIPLPPELISEVRETLLKVTQSVELAESKSMLFMEKLGF